MQKFLFVNCKGATIEQAITAMHEQLIKLHEGEQTADLEIFSVNFNNTFEQQKKSSLDLNGQNNQAVLMYNCCVTLIKPAAAAPVPDWEELAQLVADRIADRLTSEVDKFVSDEKDLQPLDDVPTEKEVRDLKQAARAFCQHTNLDPARHSKAHRNIGQWFQICRDCGAEVWQGAGITDHPGVAPGGGLHAVPIDPIGDQVNEMLDKE